MKISSKGRYAVRTMFDLATHSENYVSLSEIAQRQNITIKYLEQIISKLVKAKLIVSSRGAQGGYKLTKKPSEYSIAEILAITGDVPELAPCQKGNISCPNIEKCPTIGCWNTLSQIIYDYLQRVTLQDLINKTY